MEYAEQYALPVEGQLGTTFPRQNDFKEVFFLRWGKIRFDVQWGKELNVKVLLKINRGNQVAVPEQAVLDSGTRKQVFLVRGEGIFEPREVKVGAKIGAFYEVQEGIEAGDRVVTSGNFLIDSESKLMAAMDMMGSLGMGGIKMEQAQMGQMDMGGMPMGDTPPVKTTQMAKASGEKKAGGLTLAFSTEPASPRIGENLIRVTVKGEGSKPVLNAKVQLSYTRPMPGMMPATVPRRPTNGAVEPTVARSARASCILLCTFSIARMIDIVIQSFMFTLSMLSLIHISEPTRPY